MGAAFLGSSLAQITFALVTSLIIGRGLGVAEFGRWTLLTAWAATLTTTFDLGMSALVTRDAARDRPNAGRLVAGAIIVRLAAVAPVALLTFAMSSWLGQEAATAQAFRVTIWLAMAGLIYGCFAAAFRAWPEWLPAILVVEAAGGAIQCLGVFALVLGGSGVIELLWLATAVQLFQVTSAVVLWRLAAQGNSLAWPSWRAGWSLARRGYPFAILGIVGNVQARLATLMLGFMATPAAVASFGAASRFAAAARMIPHAGFASALPLLSYECEHGEPEALGREFHGMVRWFAVLSAAVLAVAAEPILVLTFGESFAPASPVLAWVAIGLVPSLVNNSRKVYLCASGREAIAVKWTTVSLGVQLVGAAALIPFFAASGAAIAMLLGEIVIWWPLQRIVTHRAREPRPVHDAPRVHEARNG
jgi:O-antigen/teichoic acid export membrane protein